MDIKRVQDSEKFAIILTEKEMNILKKVLNLDNVNRTYPMFHDIAEFLYELENTPRRSAQISVDDIRQMQDTLDQSNVPIMCGRQIDYIIVDDPMAGIVYPPMVEHRPEGV